MDGLAAEEREEDSGEDREGEEREGEAGAGEEPPVEGVPAPGGEAELVGVLALDAVLAALGAATTGALDGVHSGDDSRGPGAGKEGGGSGALDRGFVRVRRARLRSWR